MATSGEEARREEGDGKEHCFAYIMDGVDARHPVTPSLTQRSFACMEVEEGHGKFHRVSAGWMGSQPQKLSLSVAARTGWT